jgi:hypothetical protein
MSESDQIQLELSLKKRKEKVCENVTYMPNTENLVRYYTLHSNGYN